MVPLHFLVGRAPMVSKVACTAFVVAASLFSVSTALSQGYSTTFDGYTNGGSLSGQNAWDTNDPDKTPTTPGYTGEYVGQSDFVGSITGYSNPTTDYVAYLGGGEHGTTNPYVLPGVQTVYTYHPFTLGTTNAYAFNVDMSLVSNTTFATRDSFAWTFLSSASGTTIGSNLFSLNFVPDATTYTSAGGRVTSLMNIFYSVNGGAQVATGRGISYDSNYHLTISVNVAAKTATVALTPTGGTASTIATINLSAISPGTVQEVAATWQLAPTTTTKDANGGYTAAGGNELLFNNYAVTVPEPSTWALVGLGTLGFAAYLRRRARA